MSGAKTYLTHVETDRGISWEASQQMLADFRVKHKSYEDHDTSEVRACVPPQGSRRSLVG